MPCGTGVGEADGALVALGAGAAGVDGTALGGTTLGAGALGAGDGSVVGTAGGAGGGGLVQLASSAPAAARPRRRNLRLDVVMGKGDCPLPGRAGQIRITRR